MHGTKVGVATIAALRLYEMLKETELKSEAVKAKAFSYDVWAKEIEAAYGSAASGVLQLEQEVEKNSDKEVLRRQKAWEEKAGRNRKDFGTSSKNRYSCGCFKIDESTGFTERDRCFTGNFQKRDILRQGFEKSFRTSSDTV